MDFDRRPDSVPDDGWDARVRAGRGQEPKIARCLGGDSRRTEHGANAGCDGPGTDRYRASGLAVAGLVGQVPGFGRSCEASLPATPAVAAGIDENVRIPDAAPRHIAAVTLTKAIIG